MSREKMCLLCKTKNVKFDDEFLDDKRAYFSAPKLLELRITWNEAITKMHPFLKTYVDNVNTYQICDLHFRESDIKKNFEKNGNIVTLPISKWGLKIEALPLSFEKLESEKNQKKDANTSVGEINKKTETLEKEKSQNENDEEKSEGKQSEKSLDKLQGDSRVNTGMDQGRENKPENNNSSKQTEEMEDEDKKTETLEKEKSQNDSEEEKYRFERNPVFFEIIKKVQEAQKGKENVTILEPKKSLSSKKISPENNNVPEREKITPAKSVIRPIRPDYSNKVDVKVAPYPVLKSFKQKANFKGAQIVQITSGKNVFVVPRGAQVIPLTPISSMPNTSSPAIRVPVVTQVTLQGGSPVTKLIPITTIGSKSSIPQPINNVVPAMKVSSASQVSLVKTVPLISREKSGNSIAKVTPVSEVTKVNPISAVEKVPPISINTKKVSVNEIASPSLKSVANVNPAIEVPEEYDRDKLLLDLQRYPLPTGWAYSLTTTNQILFTQYHIQWKYPIFLRLDDNRKAMISVGYLATNFIPYELELECYANLTNGLRKLENVNWCKGIGFNNHNHSDLCLIVVGRANTRCKECARIRKNEQRIESEEIMRRQKQKRGKHLKDIRNIKRINQRLEAKISKLKLMVAHLKNKQCVDCLHEKFMKKTLVQTESVSKSV